MLNSSDETQTPTPLGKNVVGTVPSSKLYHIVGIGASAGGLSAFESFFSAIPTNYKPDTAFVIVQHLSPSHKSILTNLIQNYTSMKVVEVESGMHIVPGFVYIIPPHTYMEIHDEVLYLKETVSHTEISQSIDCFFTSLAKDVKNRAIAVILSGTGSDGSLGIKDIKYEGGVVFAQEPTSAEFDGMIKSAVETNLVDYILPPEKIFQKISELTIAEFATIQKTMISLPHKSEKIMKRIFLLLKTQTDHDFSQYKPNTIIRRIERRMAVLGVNTIEKYIETLENNPLEIDALFQDLLIGVTSFFRDKEAFAIMEKDIIPELFTQSKKSNEIRIWSAGCSTGEEAYSIAILLQEHLEGINEEPSIQIFATDVDPFAITTARTGLFPLTIADSISAERLKKYFSLEPDGKRYRIQKKIRDMLIFSQLSILKDPPFSRLNLISCRNLLIYLDNALQKKLIPIFHYALNPEGYLFLGTSETVGEYTNLFTSINRNYKIFQRKNVSYVEKYTSLNRFIPSMKSFEPIAEQMEKVSTAPLKIPLRELTEKAILEYGVPAAIMVNNRGDILYIHGRTGNYLEPMPGEVGVSNILKMAREGLKRPLTTMLHNVVISQEMRTSTNIKVTINGHISVVDVSVFPISPDAKSTKSPALFLVIFSDSHSTGYMYKKADQKLDKDPNGEESQNLEILKEELRSKEEYIQITNEELETTIEELRSSNEELQSVNEEFQSTNEELETSKEELQSVNEELATVNTELQNKIADLSRINNDMNNLLAGTGIGTIFVDHNLRILRFTPAVTQIINLIKSDIGRSVGDIVSNLKNYENLIEDLHTVLNTLIVKEVEVETQAGVWYMMRIQPYRTLNNVIEGAVITFVDITAVKNARDELYMYKVHNRLATVVRDAYDAVTVHDLDDNIIAWNPGAEKLYGWSEEEALQMKLSETIPSNLIKNEKDALLQLVNNDIIKPYKTHRKVKNGETVEIWLTATALVNEEKQVYAIATTERLSK